MRLFFLIVSLLMVESAVADIVVVATSSSPATVYYGSPDVCVLAGGDILVKFDEFGPGGHTDGTDYDRTILYRSEDGGVTWSFVTNVDGIYWSRFVRGTDGLYMVGTSRRFGTPVIMQSTDSGETWGSAVEIESGDYWHCAPQPNVTIDGVAYFTFERNMGGVYPHEDAYVMSCPIDDLMTAESWETSSVLTRDASLYPTTWGHSEGTLIDDGAGGLQNWLRADVMVTERNAISRLTVTLDPLGLTDDGTVAFDGGYTKFQIWLDSYTGDYFCLRNSDPVNDGEDRRTIIALDRSSDLIYWRRALVLVELASSDYEDAGEQYPSAWDSRDGDLHVVIRTAQDGIADSYHNSNAITYVKIENYRKY